MTKDKKHGGRKTGRIKIGLIAIPIVVLLALGILAVRSPVIAEEGVLGGLSINLSVRDIKDLACTLFNKGCPEVVSAPILGAFPGPEILEKVFLKGGLVTGLVVRATTTGVGGSSVTLEGQDVTAADYWRVSIDNTSGLATGGDMNLTLPASTSLRNLVPFVGAVETKCYFLFGTSSAARLVWTAGTGIDLRFASTTAISTQTAGTLATVTGEEGCFRFMRQPDDGGGPGDITGVVEFLIEAD